MMAFERHARLMAHGGQEPGLGGIRLLGGGARQFERLLLELAIGNVAHHGDDVGLGLTCSSGRQRISTQMKSAGIFWPRTASRRSRNSTR